MSQIDKLFSKLKGGAGSGNFGHSGRPGKRGGSASASSGGSTNRINSIPTSSERVIIPKFQIVQEEIEKSLKSPKIKELKGVINKLKGSGDLREDIGEILKRNGYRYESSYSGASSQGDIYYRGQFDVTVDFSKGKTSTSIVDRTKVKY